MDILRPGRPHSPNSCGQVQAADMGIMGGPAKKLNPDTGKMMAVPGSKIFVGGRIGEDADLSMDPSKKGIPLDYDELIPELVDILKTEFGAREKTAAAGEAAAAARAVEGSLPALW